MRPILWFLTFAMAALGFSTGHAAIVYSESVSGDLPNSGLSPLLISVAPGSNQILGVTSASNNVIDRDYFRITLPEGLQLAAIEVLPGTQTGGSLSFIGIQAGNQITVDPAGASAAGLLGWTHYSAGDTGQDILGRIGTGPGASGFAPPLPGGSYAFWVQERGPGSFSYGFDLKVTPVPLPGAFMAMLSGLGLMGMFRRRRAAFLSR